MGIILHYFNVPNLIQFILFFILILKVFYFIKSASIAPSIGSDVNQFSWKYIQSLPLNKPDIFLLILLSNLYAMSPSIMMVVCFRKFILTDLFDIEIITYSTILKLILFIIPMILWSSALSLKNLIQFPRQQFIKKNEGALFLQHLKKLIIIAFCLTYGMLAMEFIDDEFGYNSKIYLLLATKYLFLFATTWWLSPALIMAVFLYSKRTIKIWQNEDLSYQKINWKPKRDGFLTAILASLIFFNFNLNYFLVPAYLKQPQLHKAIATKNSALIKELLQAGADVNQKNKYGFTPLMVFAYSGGDPTIFEALIKAGAKKEGHVSAVVKGLAGDNILALAIRGGQTSLVRELIENGFPITQKNAAGESPLHLMANYCDSANLDLLLKKTSDIDQINQRGQTPLHVASERNCFNGVISLLEAGTDPFKKDLKGKTALDYRAEGKEGQSGLGYFLHKKTRAPAAE